MGKLRAVLGPMADAAKAGKKVGARAADLINPQLPRGDLGGLDNLAEYEDAATALRTANETPPSTGAVQQEIATRRAVESEEQRAKHILDPKADPLDSLGHQTNGPVEFEARYRNQLTDPVHSVKAVNEGRIPSEDAIMRIETKRAKYEQQSGLLRHRVGKSSPRWQGRVDEWFEDSPYRFDVMYHTDRTTAPDLVDEWIQYVRPRELGIHAGTNDAAEGMLGRGGVEDLLKQEQDVGNTIEELAGLLDVPPKEIERILGNEVQAHIFRKFRMQEPPTFAPDEWDILVDNIGLQMGAAGRAEAGKLLAKMKAMPTPNTTPTLFKGKNGLLLQDNGGFGSQEVGSQLEQLFPDDVDAILAARTGGNVAANLKLQKFIESKGFDHVVYHNSVEDKGQLSIINWNPDLMKSIYHGDFAGDNMNQGAAVAAAGFLAIMGVGSANIRTTQQEGT